MTINPDRQILQYLRLPHVHVCLACERMFVDDVSYSSTE